ncbi:Acyl-CoA synthetase (AMP-forming)/AMP-acid ligase II [Ferrithrix thermotolerans DSM 19514]|uniref:Acyl-CoA synthetase (AMP-forming)/AMP-acid ligase II n=1 Tax=Ferrithrix thermotolerans DSM 19514 TaxID=1121881 RepID=A0A1M4WWB6_9ACTN|nr:AMP-binding protein [Ferrithrix thermotolerans]SHE85529.1 Acyl-CoA synthetase (AMP-forming)/AMP-acid ligase II [Ferrithrix thermotolerans DSM 19514]
MKVALSVNDFLRRGVTVFPDRLALVDEPNVPGSLGRITYRSFDSRVKNMAKRLEEMGVQIGDRVAIISPNAGKFLVSYFGVSGYGRILVPVNYRLTKEEVAYIIEHSGSQVVLVDHEFAHLAEGLDVKKVIVLDGVSDAELFQELPDGESPPSEWDPDEDFTCSINYTSGTTSRPKGVQLTHRNVWTNATTLALHTSVTDRDVLIHTLPMFHCNGWGMPYAVTGLGGTHVIQRKIDGESILSRVDAEGVTLACGAPAVWAATLNAADERARNGQKVPGRDEVRVVVAGAPPPSKMIERIETELGWEFIQIYGLTETSPLLTVNRAPKEWGDLKASERAKLLSRAGTPAIGVEIKIDADGEVLARSNHVFAGYWNQPKETEEALRDGWFHTGDGGYFRDGYLTIEDRKKDVIITGGENVSSIEVEDAIFQHKAVAEVAVIGVPSEKWGEEVKALVVLKEGESATEEEIIAFCKSQIAGYKCPKSVEFRKELSRTATGKLQKYKLRAPYWEGLEKKVN